MSSNKYTGRVKWFNSKAGYGFITVVSDEHKDDDIFVHHSSLMCGAEQYKYLVQGEYVEFILTETNDQNHKFQADNVTGILQNKLMCETRTTTVKRTNTNRRFNTRNAEVNES